MATGRKNERNKAKRLEGIRFQMVNRKFEIATVEWLPDMDLNHDKVIQSHLCYRYTIGQDGRIKLENFG